jgi:hypothetical protein
MSRSIRFAAAALILASLLSGSLWALPPSSRPAATENGKSDFLSALVEWIASLLAPDRPAGDALREPQSKEGSYIDPAGSPH